ncbi:hypothetical protein PG993_001513 [Apiospora rasikravindrae]|uniref:Rhodopsin domain-containing protein n=1 Tax=Apiospora rasikravindrae TaxID=990691 RepID=A0ABR1UDP9_9PEZI
MPWTFNTDDDAPTDAVWISVVALLFTSLSFVSVLLRAYVRVVLVKASGVDDVVIALAWLASCGFAVVTVIQTKWGLGLQNVGDMPPENFYNFGLLQFIGAPFYITSILFFKLSLLLSYFRFLPLGIWKFLTVIISIVCILFHAAFLVVQINLCTPIAKQWDPTITSGHCIEAVPFYTTVAAMTIVLDVLVMLLPFPTFYASKIQKRKKAVLLGLFALGIFITIIQMFRIQTIKSLANYLDSAKLIMWSTIENNLGIIVTCVPTLAPLVKYFSEKTRRDTTGGNTRYGRNSAYALNTWKDGGIGGGDDLQCLGSHNDREVDITGSRAAESQENILEGLGIVRKTEVTVVRQASREA